MDGWMKGWMDTCMHTCMWILADNCMAVKMRRKEHTNTHTGYPDEKNWRLKWLHLANL